jgi:hypothetical protein
MAKVSHLKMSPDREPILLDPRVWEAAQDLDLVGTVRHARAALKIRQNAPAPPCNTPLVPQLRYRIFPNKFACLLLEFARSFGGGRGLVLASAPFSAMAIAFAERNPMPRRAIRRAFVISASRAASPPNRAWVWANYGTRKRPAVTLTLPPRVLLSGRRRPSGETISVWSAPPCRVH